MNLREERRRLFDAAVKGTRPKRVPTYFNGYTYKYTAVSNYKLSDYLYNFDVIREVQDKFHKHFNYDGYHDFGARNIMSITDKLGKRNYEIDDETGALSARDNCFMDDGDYGLICEKGLLNYVKEDFLGKKYPACDKAQFFSRFKEAFKVGLEYNKVMSEITEMMTEENQTLKRADNTFVLPMEYFFDSFVGMKALAIDLKRHKEELAKACDVLWASSGDLDSQKEERAEITLDAREFTGRAMAFGDPKDFVPTPIENKKGCFDYQCTFTPHIIMNGKEFQRYLLPYLKEAWDYAAATNQTIFLYAEGEILRLKKYLEDIPRNTIALYSELDDIFEMKKQFGDRVALVGGFPAHLLGSGTKQQCIDFCKRLMDEVAYDGRYIYSEDQLMSYPNDAKPENLKAVVDFFREHEIQY